MEKFNLVEQVAQELNLTKKEANSVIQTIFAAIEEGLVQGETIRVSSFGSFQVKTRAERKGVNPKTGEEIVIPETKVVAFKPAVALSKKYCNVYNKLIII